MERQMGRGDGEKGQYRGDGLTSGEGRTGPGPGAGSSPGHENPFVSGQSLAAMRWTVVPFLGRSEVMKPTHNLHEETREMHDLVLVLLTIIVFFESPQVLYQVNKKSCLCPIFCTQTLFLSFFWVQNSHEIRCLNPLSYSRVIVV